ncbi:MAG: phosphate ABC transporter permease subunit PstC [Aquisalinus sp.]|nr:phosphate ABC transporter permease subunit PstC [Aquisalinus sp.]
MNLPRLYIAGSAAFAAVMVVLVFMVLMMSSWGAISSEGLGLFTHKWHPAGGEFGVLPMIFGSAAVTLIALTIATPLGLLAAIFTSELLNPAWRAPVKSALEILAGIPSIIYGLIGVAFFSIWIGNLFDLQSGRTILTAGILLAIMILPTIITLCDDALHNVPQKYRESATGLGLYKYEVVRDVLLPIAKTDITGAILLALGRALGETMAVMLVIGSIDRVPDPFFNVLEAGQSITSKLGREIAESSFGSVHFSALIFMSLILVAITVSLTSFTQYYFRREKRLVE